MISGRQIREARMMLGWTGDELCTRANIADDVLTRAEAVDGTPSITLHQAALIQQAFERAGMRSGQQAGGERAKPMIGTRLNALIGLQLLSAIKPRHLAKGDRQTHPKNRHSGICLYAEEVALIRIYEAALRLFPA